MDIDLATMSLKELQKLQADLTKAIAEYGSRKKRDALTHLESVAREHGFSLQELFMGASVKKTRAAAKPKYVHPQDPSVTWSGRGRKPKWFDDLLASGKTPEDLQA